MTPRVLAGDLLSCGRYSGKDIRRPYYRLLPGLLTLTVAYRAVWGFLDGVRRLSLTGSCRPRHPSCPRRRYLSPYPRLIYCSR